MKLFQTHRTPRTSAQLEHDEAVLALKRKQEQRIAEWIESRPAFLAKWFRRHPVPYR